MAWKTGILDGPLTAQAVMDLGLDRDLIARVVDAVLVDAVVYVAIRSSEGEIFALLLHTKQKGERLSVKPVAEDQGPFEDRCPPRILDLLTDPKNNLAEEWRNRCLVHSPPEGD